MKTNIYDTLALPWLCLVFTVNYGMSEVDFTVVDFDPTSTVILPCSADADRVVWLDSSRAPVVELRNNKEISHRNRFYLTRSYGYEKNLKIEMVKKQDGGNYSCLAERRVICKYNLIVNHEAEMAQSSNSSNDVKEFSTVRLWCNATGMPEPKTTWYVLDESGKEQPLGFTGSYMEIRNVTRGCSGIYRCKSTNRLNGNSPAYVDMAVKAVYSPEVDISLDEPEENVSNFTFDDIDIEYTVFYRILASKKTSTVILTCHVSANPNASISWKVGEEVIGIYTSGEIKHVSGQDNYLYELNLVNGALKLKIQATGDHAILFNKQYKCESTNSIGRDHCSVVFELAI